MDLWTQLVFNLVLTVLLGLLGIIAITAVVEYLKKHWRR